MMHIIEYSKHVFHISILCEVNGLKQDYSICSVLASELNQSFT